MAAAPPDYEFGFDLKIERLRFRLPQHAVAEEMGIPEWKLGRLEGRGYIAPGDADAYRRALAEAVEKRRRNPPTRKRYTRRAVTRTYAS